MADLESVISASIAGMSGSDGTATVAPSGDTGDAGDDTGEAVAGGTEGVAAEGAEAVVAKAEGDEGSEPEGATAEDGEEGDPFAKEFGLQEPKEGQRENRLPYTRVKAIVGNAQKKLFKALTGEDLAAGETVEKGIERFAAQITEYKGSAQRLQSYDRVEQIMLNEPAKFLQLLPHVNPAYADLLTPKAVERAPAAPKGDFGPEPEPDVDLGNGQFTYSPAGMKAWLKWQAKQDRAEIEADLRKEYEEQLKPFKEEREGRQKFGEKVEGVRKLQDEAYAEWPGFADHQTEILKALQADKRPLYPHQALLSAYFKVVIPKYKADREAMRKELLEEAKKAPAATSVKGSKGAGNKNVAQAPQEERGGDAVESAIFSAINKLPGR